MCVYIGVRVLRIVLYFHTFLYFGEGRGSRSRREKKKASSGDRRAGKGASKVACIEQTKRKKETLSRCGLDLTNLEYVHELTIVV